MENKTETPITEFNEVTKTMTDEQILADNYIISQSISKIILKKYSKLMKKNEVTKTMTDEQILADNYIISQSQYIFSGITQSFPSNL